MSDNSCKTAIAWSLGEALSGACKKMKNTFTARREGEHFEGKKAAFAWSIISKDGETIPGNSESPQEQEKDLYAECLKIEDYRENAEIGESVPQNDAPDLPESQRPTIPFPQESTSVLPGHENLRNEILQGNPTGFPVFTGDLPGGEFLGLFRSESQGAFDPEMMREKLKSLRLLPFPAVEQEVPEQQEQGDATSSKKPIIEFRSALENGSGSSEKIPSAIGVPRELLHSGELLSETMLRRSESVLSGKAEPVLEMEENIGKDWNETFWNSLSAPVKRMDFFQRPVEKEEVPKTPSKSGRKKKTPLSAAKSESLEEGGISPGQKSENLGRIEKLRKLGEIWPLLSNKAKKKILSLSLHTNRKRA